MAYIELENVGEIIRKLSRQRHDYDNYYSAICDFEGEILALPTEDVVPRSEVEDLKCQLEREREYIEFLKANIVSGKQEVAREIFREIDKIYFCKRVFAELRKKYIGE